MAAPATAPLLADLLATLAAQLALATSSTAAAAAAAGGSPSGQLPGSAGGEGGAPPLTAVLVEELLPGSFLKQLLGQLVAWAREEGPAVPQGVRQQVSRGEYMPARTPGLPHIWAMMWSQHMSCLDWAPEHALSRGMWVSVLC
jgi:hypothetical protein